MAMNAPTRQEARIDLLCEYLDRLVEGPVSKELFERYRPIVEDATPFEVNHALEHLLADSDDIAACEVPVARFIRSVGKALEKQTLPVYAEGTLLFQLNEENEAIASDLTGQQELNKRLQQRPELPLSVVLDEVASYEALEEHYIRLQNELFPLFEASGEAHSCVKLMWTLQDEVLASRKALLAYSSDDRPAFWRIYGRYYVLSSILSFRERYILFPVVHRSLQGETGVREKSAMASFVSRTGSLTAEQLERIFALLPFDISFIGSDDRVKFYSDPPHRIFPRSPQVIGRLVQNCHPPKSVSTVEEILASFKEGRADEAEFYLVLNGSFVHITYYAVRSADGTYLGTMEVSQDATHLRSLMGEKRLL
jgi:DUF438 domain-containing protein